MFSLKSRKSGRYRIRDNTNRVLSAIEFRSKKTHTQGDKAELIFSLSKNEYNGNIYINLYIEEIL